MRALPLVTFLFLAGETLLGRPIEVEVGRGRNWNAVKLVDQAQDQLFKENNVAAARKSVEAAIKADPTYWPALYIRAEVLVREHHYEAAIADCESILRQDSTVIEAALLRAEANFYTGR